MVAAISWYRTSANSSDDGTGIPSAAYKATCSSGGNYVATTRRRAYWRHTGTRIEASSPGSTKSKIASTSSGLFGALPFRSLATFRFSRRFIGASGMHPTLAYLTTSSTRQTRPW
jgi:hypothetical protein